MNIIQNIRPQIIYDRNRTAKSSYKKHGFTYTEFVAKFADIQRTTRNTRQIRNVVIFEYYNVFDFNRKNSQFAEKRKKPLQKNNSKFLAFPTLF